MIVIENHLRKQTVLTNVNTSFIPVTLSCIPLLSITYPIIVRQHIVHSRHAIMHSPLVYHISHHSTCTTIKSLPSYTLPSLIPVTPSYISPIAITPHHYLYQNTKTIVQIYSNYRYSWHIYATRSTLVMDKPYHSPTTPISIHLRRAVYPYFRR